MGGHAHSHRSGAETLSVFGVIEPADSRSKSVGGSRSFSSCLVTECQGGGKDPPKKYAIKLPRDLTSRFEQGEEMKRKEAIKAEEENRRKQEEACLLVGPPSSALKP